MGGIEDFHQVTDLQVFQSNRWLSNYEKGSIDAHFHLDKLYRRPNKTLSDLEDSSSFPIAIPFAIANYVFQGSWKYLGDHVIADPGLRTTLGMHPHMITDPQVDICGLKRTFGSVSIGRGHWRGWPGLYYCVQT